ncbi:MAG: DUF3784 domain-containing protein [Lachnospiraceae bacterium]|nr:DUF3784 domain-containing protein [Lachnospiraceae bacterium]
MDFFMSTTFDWIIAAVLAFCAGALLIGKGDFILTAFQGKNKGKNDSPYEPKKYSRVMGILCLIMLAAELVFIFAKGLASWIIIVCICIVVVSFIFGIWYLKKYCLKDDKKK